MAVFHLPQETPKTHKASLLQNSCCGSRGGRFTVVWAENHGYHWDTRGTTWGHHGGIRCNLPFYWYIDVQYIVYSGDIRISNWSTGYELWVCLKLCKKKTVPAIAGQRMIKHQIGMQISNGWVSTALPVGPVEAGLPATLWRPNLTRKPVEITQLNPWATPSRKIRPDLATSLGTFGIERI